MSHIEVFPRFLTSCRQTQIHYRFSISSTFQTLFLSFSSEFRISDLHSLFFFLAIINQCQKQDYYSFFLSFPQHLTLCLPLRHIPSMLRTLTRMTEQRIQHRGGDRDGVQEAEAEYTALSLCIRRKERISLNTYMYTLFRRFVNFHPTLLPSFSRFFLLALRLSPLPHYL